MAADSMKTGVDEWLRVIGHLYNVKRLRSEARRLGQNSQTLDALDSVIQVDAARADALLEQIQTKRFAVPAAGQGSKSLVNARKL